MSNVPRRQAGEQSSSPDEAAAHALINLRQAAMTLPTGRGGRPVHAATLVRWITNGSGGPNGETVRLRAVRMGGRWLTSAAWLEEFGRRLTPSFEDSPIQRTPATRHKEVCA